MSDRASVWKYELRPGITELTMPHGAKPLHVHSQNGGVYLWALVVADNPARPLDQRAFITLGTGHLEDPAYLGDYIGTAHLDGLVFHVFEAKLP